MARLFELPVQLGDACPASVRDAWWLKLYREATGRALARTATPVMALAEPPSTRPTSRQTGKPDLDGRRRRGPGPSLEQRTVGCARGRQDQGEGRGRGIEAARARRRGHGGGAEGVGDRRRPCGACRKEAADDLVTRLARDFQGLSVEDLQARLRASEAAPPKGVGGARAATAWR